MHFRNARGQSRTMGAFNWNELLEDPEAIEASPLERVIAVWQGRTVKGITVELHALEVRELLLLRDAAGRHPPASLAFDHMAPELSATAIVAGDIRPLCAAQSRTSPGREQACGCARDSHWCRTSPTTRAISDVRVVRFGRQMLTSFWSPEGRVERMTDPSWVYGPWEFRISCSDRPVIDHGSDRALCVGMHASTKMRPVSTDSCAGAHTVIADRSEQAPAWWLRAPGRKRPTRRGHAGAGVDSAGSVATNVSRSPCPALHDHVYALAAPPLGGLRLSPT